MADAASFGADTTTDEVLAGFDLTGRTAVVTGASAGLGVETTRALASVGATVVMAVRDRAKGEGAAARVRAEVPDARLELVTLDLASLDSVRAAAGEILAGHERIDLLINNAGVMACPLGRTVDGFETQLGTNHLGHFLFTNLLVPALLAGAPARVVNLTSRGHVRSDVVWEDPNYRERPYEKWEAYGQSKTANVLFTVELERRLGGRGVHAFAVHPGVIMTELSRYITREEGKAVTSARRAAPMPRKSVPAGAATSVWAATAPGLVERGGSYLEDCQVSTTVWEPGADRGYAPYALDPRSAARLWAWSEEQVGQAFPEA